MKAAVSPLSVSPILVDQVYEQLTLAITARRLEPGARIRQADLAMQLGVSRQPVSHALQLLKKQGLVQDRGRKGLEVAPMDPGHIRNLYQVRGALDTLAARLAAERAKARRLSRDDRAALEATVEAGLRLGANASVMEMVKSDVAFHRLIYSLSGNPSIMETLEPQFPHLMRSMHVVLEAPVFRSRAWGEHAAIAAAVLAGDVAGAMDAAFRHAEAAGSETERRLTAG